MRKVASTARRRWLVLALACGATSPLAAQTTQPPALNELPPTLQGGVVEAPAIPELNPAQQSGNTPTPSIDASQKPVTPPTLQQGKKPQDGKQNSKPPVVGEPQKPIKPDTAGPTVRPPVEPPQTQTQPVQPGPVQPPQLNTDPNADIEDLVPAPVPPTPATTPPAPQTSRRQAGLGATRGSYSASPYMIGDLFGGSFSTFGGFQTVNFSQYAPATVLSATPDGAANGLLVFEFGADIVPNDVFTTGLGTDVSGDVFADTFSIAEPIPPSDALTSPGPGFVFDGGTAILTNNTTNTTAQDGAYTDGSTFLIAYSYTAALNNGVGGGRPVPGPGVSTRRVKLSENFSPEVRDRCFFSYNFFNDAFGGLGDVSRYTLGFERQIIDGLFSFEARLITAGTYASTQNLDQREARDFEVGNAALISKFVLLRTDRLLLSGGLGMTLPTADDTRVFQGGRELLRVENQTVHLLPFTALLWRHSRDTAFQAYMQFDGAVNGDPVLGDLTGNSLPRLGVFTDSTLLNLDFALSHVLYRSGSRSLLQEAIGNAELHYTGTLEESDFVSNGTLTYTNLKRNFNVVNATAGVHLVLNNDVVVTPAMSVPLRSGLDEQFDYEAMVQVNWLR